MGAPFPPSAPRETLSAPPPVSQLPVLRFADYQGERGSRGPRIGDQDQAADLCGRHCRLPFVATGRACILEQLDPGRKALGFADRTGSQPCLRRLPLRRPRLRRRRRRRSSSPTSCCTSPQDHPGRDEEERRSPSSSAAEERRGDRRRGCLRCPRTKPTSSAALRLAVALRPVDNACAATNASGRDASSSVSEDVSPWPSSRGAPTQARAAAGPARQGHRGRARTVAIARRNVFGGYARSLIRLSRPADPGFNACTSRWPATPHDEMSQRPPPRISRELRAKPTLSGSSPARHPRAPTGGWRKRGPAPALSPPAGREARRVAGPADAPSRDERELRARRSSAPVGRRAPGTRGSRAGRRTRAECARIAGGCRGTAPSTCACWGSGRNGHLLMNEPAAALPPGAHVARLAASTRRHSMVRALKTPPRRGLTMGLADILRSRTILLLVSGRHKAARPPPDDERRRVHALSGLVPVAARRRDRLL